MSDDQSTLLKFMYTLGLFGGGSDALSDYAENGETPQVVLDFVNETYAKAGTVQSAYTDVATFARASTGYYFNSSGVLTSASSGTPRIGSYLYSGAAWVDKGLMLESEARTNLFTYSNDFTQSWAENTYCATMTQPSGVNSPDGTENAWLLVDDGGGGIQRKVSVFSSNTYATSTTHTFSVFAKANGLSWVAVGTSGMTTPANGDVYFNLSAGTVGTQDAGFTGYITDVGGGWYRCSIVFTTDPADTSGAMVISPADGDGDANVDRDGTSSVYIYGAQLEVGSLPSSYLPTSGATATRAAETLTIAAANMSWASGGVSMHQSGTMSFLDNNTDVGVNGGAGEVSWYTWKQDNSNFIDVSLNTNTGAAGTGTAYQTHKVGGTFVASTGGSYSEDLNVDYNVATREATSVSQVALDGTSGTNQTPAGFVNLTSTDFSIGRKIMGHVGLFRQWNVNIAQAGIESAST